MLLFERVFPALRGAYTTKKSLKPLPNHEPEPRGGLV